MTIRTYLDTGVLIAAYQGDHASHEAAIKIITEGAEREFVSSDLVKLELLPKALFNKRDEEFEFYNTFLSNVDVISLDPNSISDGAYKLSSQYGLAACDALHIHTAINSSVAEFITTEKKGKAFFRIPANILTSTTIHVPVKQKNIFDCLRSCFKVLIKRRFDIKHR